MGEADVKAKRQPARAGSASIRFIDQFLKTGATTKLTGLMIGQLDAFNRISSTFGADRSKAFCAEYAQQLRSMLPPSTPVIRLSERRFAILLSIDAMAQLIDIASRLGEEQPPQFAVGDDTLLVDLMLGIAVYPTHAHDGASLFRRAELALNEARSREHTFEIYRPDATQQQATLWKFASDLEKAIQQGQIEIYFQPKVRTSDGVTVGAEALVRWRQEDGQLVMPGDFIPLAERSGSIVPMTWTVFDKVAELIESWTLATHNFSIAINISAQVLDHVDFKANVMELNRRLDRQGVGLVLELTEETLVANFSDAIKKVKRIRELGVGFAIDDFGKGYSSLTYLKDIPATEIKVDRKFISRIGVDAKDRQIVKATMELAEAFGMKVVAEGVDNGESMRTLSDLGCELAQGFYISRPMRGELLEDWVRKNLRNAGTPLVPLKSVPAGYGG